MRPLPEEFPVEEFARVSAACQYIEQLSFANFRLRPRVGLVLGSGLAAFAVEVAERLEIPYEAIPHWPRPTTPGHSGRLLLGKLAEVPVAVMVGRLHLYEGYSVKKVTFPVRVLGCLGVRSLVVTNAAGAVNPELPPGELALICDHLNLLAANPLVGPNEERFGPRFLDMSEAYDRRYRSLAREAAQQLGLPLAEGVYAALPGPSYETPAEIRYLRAIGADLVGMSTVPEVIVANHIGMRVLGLSCVTNLAAGLGEHLRDHLGEEKLSHEEVLEVGAQATSKLVALLRAVVPRIAQETKSTKP